MLKQRHRDDAFDTELSVAAEERIREDERRRVLAEMADDRPADVDDQHQTVPAGDPAPTGDPRRWDIPGDRWEHDPATRTDEVPAATQHVVEEQTVTERSFSPGQFLIALAGVVALAFGIVAVARTGLGGSLTEPVEPVLGWDHTALLGWLEIGAGVVMLLASLRPWARWLGGLVGLAAIAGGILIVGQFDDEVDSWIADHLAAEQTFGWVAIAIGAVAVVGAAIPRLSRTRRVSTTHSMAT